MAKNMIYVSAVEYPETAAAVDTEINACPTAVTPMELPFEDEDAEDIRRAIDAALSWLL